MKMNLNPQVKTALTAAAQIIYTNLRGMSERCSNAGSCMYRFSKQPTDPRRCLIGGLIADEHYSPRLEGKRACDPQIQNAISQSHPDWHMDEWPENDRRGFVDTLVAIQTCHDTANNIEETRSRAKGLLDTWQQCGLIGNVYV